MSVSPHVREWPTAFRCWDGDANHASVDANHVRVGANHTYIDTNHAHIDVNHTSIDANHVRVGANHNANTLVLTTRLTRHANVSYRAAVAAAVPPRHGDQRA
eukprot:1630196-Pyramimonas_sp.AAC.1